MAGQEALSSARCRAPLQASLDPIVNFLHDPEDCSSQLADDVSSCIELKQR